MARGLAARTPALVMSFYQNLLYLIVAGAMGLLFGGGVAHEPNGVMDFLFRAWAMPSLRDLLLLASCGPISAIGMTLLSQAYRQAEANFVTSFEYTGLIWATLWGFFIFGESPDEAMIIGAALIIGAGLYMLYGVRRRR